MLKWPIDMLTITYNILSITGVSLRDSKKTMCVQNYLLTCWKLFQIYCILRCACENRRWTVDNRFLMVKSSEKKTYMCSKWPVDMLIITPNILSILGVCMKTGVELLTICFGWYKVVKKYLYVFKMTRWHVDNHPQHVVYLRYIKTGVELLTIAS